MCYRSTPCSSTGASPAELLMGRKIRTTLPTLDSNLLPKWPNKKVIKRNDAAKKKEQAYYYNRRHGVKNLPVLYPGNQVLTKVDTQKSWLTKATVMKWSVTPRSYLLETEQGGMLRRNRRHLQEVPVGKAPITTSVNTPQHETAIQTSLSAVKTPNVPEQYGTNPSPDGLIRTRSGRISRPPQVLDL